MNEESASIYFLSNDNGSISELFHPSFYERGFQTSAYVGIFLCIFSIFFNLLLLALIFTSAKLRFHYIYVQILNIALADLSFVVMVDSFTVYFELQSWRLGAVFCKTWIILDVILPSVSLLGLLLLNLDRVLFLYKTSLYRILTQRYMFRVVVILCPWCISCITVNSLWLGFPIKIDTHLPGACLYGITKEANDASIWLMVFIPSLVILLLLIFIFIAVIGDMPSAEHAATLPQTGDCSEPLFVQAHSDNQTSEQRQEETAAVQERLHAMTTTRIVRISTARGQRQFVAALLLVDLISLVITLPYSAYSQVTLYCKNQQSCQSIVTLFQILSWLKSSAAFFRPVFFILLTDIYLNLKKILACWFVGRSHDNSDMLLRRNEQRRQCQ